MIFLGIESSCDETSVGLVEKIDSSYRVLANKVITQVDIHKQYGGVVPEIAARAHVDVIDTAIKSTLKECNMPKSSIDVISATQGPGLVGGLLVGSLAAKSMAIALNKPFIPVNHLHGHVLSPKIEHDIDFPYILLLISGGNCLIVIVKDELECNIIGKTIDDAPGEAFDKVARMLNLGYPGGPIIEQLAKSTQTSDLKLPIPLKNSKTLNLSFSGLKTAVLNKITNYNNISQKDIINISYAFQDAVAQSLAYKASLAVEKFGNVVKDSSSNLVFALAGGVSANNYIAEKVKEKVKQNGFKVVKPSPQYCIDNGAMIAYAASQIYNFNSGILNKSFISSNVNPRWGLENLKEFYAI